MKTKNFTLRISMMAFICLIISGSSISQGIGKRSDLPALYETMMKPAQTAQGYSGALFSRNDFDRSILKKSAENAACRSDTVIRYSINGGSEKTLHTYNGDGDLLTTLVQVWIIDRWADNNLSTNVYDENGNLLSETAQIYRGDVWVNNTMLTHTYDEAGNCLTTLDQWWDSGAWSNNYFSTFTYDGSGNMLTGLYQQWDGSAWMNAELDSITYNGAGHRIELLAQGWDGAAWYYGFMDTWTYDESGNMLTFLDQWYDGIYWVNNALTTCTYDENGNQLTKLEQMWDGVAWMNSYLTTWTYDANNNPLTVIALVSYDGVTWSNMSKSDWTYDETGNPLTFIISVADYATGEWQNYMNSEYTYEPGVITANGSLWFGPGSFWTIGDAYFPVTYFENGNVTEFFSGGPAVRVIVNYSSVVTGIENHEDGQPGNFTVYPNPANDQLEIISLNPDVKIEKLQLFDLSGKEHQITSSGNHIELINLQDGFYLLKLTCSDGLTETMKIVKQ